MKRSRSTSGWRLISSAFWEHDPNQACYKFGIMSPEYHEIKGVDGELWLRVKLE
jgi:hypothetical protein